MLSSVLVTPMLLSFAQNVAKFSSQLQLIAKQGGHCPPQING
jgi:hypothetical protein